MTLEITSNYVLPASQALTVTGRDAAMRIDASTAHYVSLAGQISGSTTQETSLNGVVVFNGVMTFTIESSGSINLVSTAAHQQVQGVSDLGPGLNFINHGHIELSLAEGGGRAVLLNGTSDQSAVVNDGVIKVVSTGLVVGIDMGGGAFTNSGLIDVVGGGRAASVAVSLQMPNAAGGFLNTGTIRAAGTGIAPGYAVVYAGAGPFENRGTLEGGYALSVALQTHNAGQTYSFINSGTMIGRVDLGGTTFSAGREVLTNTGVIRGDVTFGVEGDSYQGVGGSVTGPVHGNDGDDSLNGGASAETFYGDAGNDTLYGGAGNDSLDGGEGASLMWGEEGDDQISGGSGFDNVNGNQGADTAHGNAGDDWVVGGKDNDQVYGDAGADIVYGNLGNDTVSGGDGNDWVRGGQGDDSVSGDAGNDVVWGDRGDDTVSGGAGADTFRFFSGCGVDRVIDFSYAEGDRVVIEGGAAWTLSQSGSDTVVALSGGADTLVLVGVSLSSLPVGWIVAG